MHNTSYHVPQIRPYKNEGPIPRLRSSRTYFLQNNNLDLLMIMKGKTLFLSYPIIFKCVIKTPVLVSGLIRQQCEVQQATKGTKKSSLFFFFSLQHSSRWWQPTKRVKQILADVFDLDSRELFYSFLASFKREQEERKINCLLIGSAGSFGPHALTDSMICTVLNTLWF